MFTGIIEKRGIIKTIKKSGSSISIEIGAECIFDDAKIGDSIAVNGVCLTITEKAGKSALFFVMTETVNKTALKHLSIGSPVNLERALCLNSRLGGHIVSGHIDGTGQIADVRTDNRAKIFTVSAPSEIMRYVVNKGSIAIDGTSLTVMRAGDASFSVSVIPHTQLVTTLSEKKAGDEVNLECDIIGKYVEKLMNNEAGPGVAKNANNLTEQFLKEAGF